MKFITVIFLIATTFLPGCNYLSKMTEFAMEYETSITIPSAYGMDLPFNIVTPPIQSNAESVFSVNDTRKDLIEEVTLDSLKIQVTTPDNGDFSFLKSIEIYISADSLSEMLIAWYTDIPNDIGSLIELATTNENLKEYILPEEFSLRVNTVTDKMLLSDYELLINARFQVDAEILGF